MVWSFIGWKSVRKNEKKVCNEDKFEVKDTKWEMKTEVTSG